MVPASLVSKVLKLLHNDVLVGRHRRRATQPLRHLPLLGDISSPEIDWSACEDLLREPLSLRPEEVWDVFQTLCPNSWDFEELIPWANPTAWESLERTLPIPEHRARRAVHSGAGGCPPNQQLRAVLQGKRQCRQQAAVPPLRHEEMLDGTTRGRPRGKGEEHPYALPALQKPWILERPPLRWPTWLPPSSPQPKIKEETKQLLIKYCAKKGKQQSK